MKSLAIDFGEKKVGLALSDEQKRFSAPYKVLKRKSDKQIISDIKNILEIESIDEIIFGVPYSKDGTGAHQKRTESFIDKLKSNIDIEVVPVDESFSTQRVINKSKEDDAHSAAIFLQDYLDRLDNYGISKPK